MQFINGDVVEELSSISDKSVDLVILDPPYYRVVNDDWDNEWFTIDEYFEWFKSWFSEIKRVSKLSASLWLFGFPYQLTTLLEYIESKDFAYRQQIIVDKGLQAVAGRTSSKLKMFPTATESIFYFHNDARDVIRDLLDSERRRLGMTGKDVNAHLGKATTGGGTFACVASMKKPREHRVYPVRSDWEKLQEIMDLPNYDDLVYKFNIETRQTDVWNDINFYDRKVKKIHPTQKPVPLIERIIRASSNEGDVVLDPFMGSGSTGVACKNLNREFIGIEKDKTYFELSKDRIANQ